MDSLARNALLQLREKQTLNLEPWKEWDENPKIISATEWLANVMMNPAVADDWPVFRLDNPDLISLLKLPEKDAAKKSDGKHYSWDQITPSLQTLDAENERVETNTAPSSRTAYEQSVLKMHARLELYAQLKNTIQPQDAQNWKQELSDYQNLIPAGVAAVRAQQAGQNYDTNVFGAFLGELQRFDFMSKLEPPLIIPIVSPFISFVKSSTDWKNVGTVLLDAAKGEKISPAVQDYATMADALKSQNVAGFNSALADLRASPVPSFSQALAKARAEVFFNQMEPFYNAMVIYILAGLLAIFSWFNLSETLRRSAVWLIGLAFVIHTTGLIYRMALEGRPPVTNLYSSAIFIGWGACLLGIILERFYRNGIGAVVSAGIGFITLIIAHHLALEGDTMEMMRAVLDTNFWLATHVVAVTTGYASTFVAGFLALIYIVRGVFTKTLDEATGQIFGTDDLWDRLFRDAVQFCRHGAWRNLGGPIVGTFLGLGSEGKRRAHHRLVECAHPTSALGRHDPRTRPRELRHRREHRHELVVVRREHAGHRAAQLRLHRGGVQMAGAVCGEPTGLHRARFAAGETMEKFQGAGGVIFPPVKPVQGIDQTLFAVPDSRRIGHLPQLGLDLLEVAFD